jgi:N-acetylmuramoyl-L-alanine amidase
MEIFYYDWSESNYEADLLDFYSTDSLSESLFREKAKNKILTIDKSREVAEEIKKVVEKTDIRFRKIERDVYDVTAFTDMPSILVECNFLSNPKIEEAFNSHRTVEIYAKFLFDGIDNYFSNKTDRP